MLDFEEIKKLIPQRFPYILIDRVLDVQPGRHVVASKNISGNDIFFLGHFPEKAIMPGTAIIEAIAQTAIVLYSYKEEKEQKENKKLYYLGSVKARFLEPVVPGDQLMIKVDNVKKLADVAYASAEVFVNDRKVSEAELAFGIKDE